MSTSPGTNVTFDGTSSFEPTGACGAINSYTIDFGDGSPTATNGTGMFSHSYAAAGDYPARLTVHDSVGHASTNVAQVVIAVSSGQIQMSGVVSRKIHGTVGTFDTVLRLTTPATIEDRASGNTGASGVDYQLIFVFPNRLSSVGTISAPGVTQEPTGQIDPNNNHQYIVNLTGVPNKQYTTVTLNNVQDAANNAGNVSVIMGLLVGDTNADAAVDSADISQTKSQSGRAVTVSNYREDLNVDGAIDSADISLVKSKSGSGLPH
jgi:hypothetical protein